MSNELARGPATAEGSRLLRQVLRIVTHPATIVAGVISGLLFGFFCPSRLTRWCRLQNFTSPWKRWYATSAISIWRDWWQ